MRNICNCLSISTFNHDRWKLFIHRLNWNLIVWYSSLQLQTAMSIALYSEKHITIMPFQTLNSLYLMARACDSQHTPNTAECKTHMVILTVTQTGGSFSLCCDLTCNYQRETTLVWNGKQLGCIICPWLVQCFGNVNVNSRPKTTISLQGGQQWHLESWLQWFSK